MLTLSYIFYQLSVPADVWAYYWAIITFATVGYGDLHAYNEVEAAFIIIFVFLNIVINAWIVGESCLFWSLTICALPCTVKELLRS